MAGSRAAADSRQPPATVCRSFAGEDDRAGSVQPPWARRLEAKIDRLLVQQTALLAHAEVGRRSALVPKDVDALACILPPLLGVFGGNEFSAAEALNHPATALRLVLDGMTAQRLGKLLRRAAGQHVDGMVVERYGAESGVVLWRVARLVDGPGRGR